MICIQVILESALGYVQRTHPVSPDFVERATPLERGTRNANCPSPLRLSVHLKIAFVTRHRQIPLLRGVSRVRRRRTRDGVCLQALTPGRLSRREERSRDEGECHCSVMTFHSLRRHKRGRSSNCPRGSRRRHIQRNSDRRSRHKDNNCRSQAAGRRSSIPVDWFPAHSFHFPFANIGKPPNRCCLGGASRTLAPVFVSRGNRA